ncbi:Cuticle Protein Tweedle 4 [Frankliniella occidentalis]|nr:Cuticle Protein Tweedle 4 [Frankliniella occidentalis]
MTYAARDAVADAIREEGRSIEQQRREVEDSLNELFTRASSRFGRYAAGFPQVQARSLFNRRMSLVPPPPPPPLPYEMPPEVSKDVYIHLAADERAPTMPAPPSLPPRKHYKIIVIKPPTPSPPVETTTRRVDVETLIYVLVPKGEVPAPPTTTPRPPSKHEVFFIRYKAPVDNKTASVGRDTEAEPSFVLDTSTTTSTTKPPTMFPDYANLIDLRSSSSEISERNTPSDEDENELDGTVGDSDAINDLLSVSTDDIVRSWRRADGDIHFDADLKRIARSHSSHAESVSKDVSKGDAMDSAEDAVQEATSPPARCRQYATAEDLNAALDVGDEEGKRVQGAPDFDAVLQGKAHYGGNAEIAEICAEKSASEPFAIRNVLAPPAELKHLEDDSENQRRVDVTPKAKFSARYSSSLVF